MLLHSFCKGCQRSARAVTLCCLYLTRRSIRSICFQCNGLPFAKEMTKTRMQSMFLWVCILKSKPTPVASVINEFTASLGKYVPVYQKAVNIP